MSTLCFVPDSFVLAAYTNMAKVHKAADNLTTPEILQKSLYMCSWWWVNQTERKMTTFPSWRPDVINFLSNAWQQKTDVGNLFILTTTCYIFKNDRIEPSHRFHSALDKYPTMCHFVTEMCKKMMHYGIWYWCIAGFVQQPYQIEYEIFTKLEMYILLYNPFIEHVVITGQVGTMLLKIDILRAAITQHSLSWAS